MATLYNVLTSLQQQVSAATQGLVSNSPDTFGRPIDVQAALYWPSAKSLQNNVRPANGANGNPSALVTVYDRGLASDSTRWLPALVAQSIPDPTLTAVQSEGYVQPFETTTVTFGGVPTAGDAVGLVLYRVLGNSHAVVAVAGPTDTASTMAAQVAALLQADPVVPTWMTISAVGPVLSLTSLLDMSPVTLQVRVSGGGATKTYEIGRRRRHMQIVLWTRTPDDRITVGDKLETMIASMEADFGMTFPDQTVGRVTFTGDVMRDDATLSDTMRRDFMISVEYGISVSNYVYSVLAPVVQNTTF